MTGKVCAAGRQTLHRHVPDAVSRLAPVGRLEQTHRLKLALALPPRNQGALTQLLHDLYDPTSPSYRHYLTPEQFAAQFGPTSEDYEALTTFAKANGLTVTGTHPNRLILDVEGAVTDVERTFHVTMLTYQHPTEARQFFSADADPSVDAPMPLLEISGLNNYALPHPNLKLRPALNGANGNATPNAGTGPSGAYAGGDFRAAYTPGVNLTGAGQSVALLEFDGYYASDISGYCSKFGLSNIPLVNVAVNGGVTTITKSGSGEVSLDIEMVIAMAPGLSNIYVYEEANGGSFLTILSKMANDNLAKQLSCSWGGGSASAAAEVIFQQMASQGQSFFNASGDSDAFTGTIPFPSDSPSITQVGATTLTTSSAGGPYTSETVWNWGLDQGSYVGSSGGVSTVYSIPSWQQNVSMATNQGSTTMRNVPDVALTGDNIYVMYDNGLTGNFGGTSCAAPLWAAFTAMVNQQAINNGLQPVGFLNPTLYGIASGAGYNSNFHDVTTGNNFSSSSPSKFAAVTGYDLCTGLGTPMGATLLPTLAGPPTPTITSFSPGNGLPGDTVVLTGTNYVGVTSVAFNGVSAVYTVNSPTQITATVPASTTTGPITVVTPNGTATSATNFAVFGFNPNTGLPGATITLTGSGFTGTTAVSFNGTAASFTVNSSTKITTTVPAAATTGPISVTTAGGVVASGKSFVVLTGNGTPTIASFSPPSAAVGSGITVSGANFVNVTGATIYGVAATFTVNSPTQITVNVPPPSGNTSGPITITTALGTATSSSAFTLLSDSATFNAATDVPITASGFTAGGSLVNFSLNFAPPTGTNLTVVNNTGVAFIQGAFLNLAQGQQVTLSYNGATYNFVANYFGGTGNDLVLVWANNRPLAWGSNNDGQLGNNSTTNSLVPGSVITSGVLSGKTIVALSAGSDHSLALCSDGTLAAWGDNSVGELGNNSLVSSSTPVAVNTSGVLSGKTVVAISAGFEHSLALCSDGTAVSWGLNSNGQLGNGSTANSSVPVLVTTSSGALSGKTVVAISAGGYHNLALCSDGTLVSWGYNFYGQLGNNSTTNSTTPVLVTTSSGALSGKTIASIFAAFEHSMAVCTDGTVATWGLNSQGQLGNNSTTRSRTPVSVVTTGALSGKKVISVSGGQLHSLALCSDGTLATWGYNVDGQLGNNSTTASHVPMAVTSSGVLSGKHVVAIAGGDLQSTALCSDGTVATWGYNADGDLGNNGTTNSKIPVAANTSALAAGEAFTLIASGHSAIHTFALVAEPAFPVATTLAATSITTHSATLNGSINPQGQNTTASFQYGVTASFGSTTSGQPIGSGNSPVSINAPVTGLSAHTTYSFCASANNAAGTINGGTLTFTTPNTLPVANADSVSNVTGQITIHALANDTDADGDALSIVSVVQGTQGSVITNGQTLTYTPGSSFSGSDTFSYTISDGFGGSASASVTVTAAAVQNWRVQTFGANASNSTVSGDNADPNNNGIPNLMEYALHGDAMGTSTGASILPKITPGPSDTMQLSFTRYLDRPDVTLTVQANDSLTGSWTNLAQSVDGAPFTVITTGATVNESGSGNAIGVTVGDLYQMNDPAHPHRFMRLQVTRP